MMVEITDQIKDKEHFTDWMLLGIEWDDDEKRYNYLVKESEDLYENLEKETNLLYHVIKKTYDRRIADCLLECLNRHDYPLVVINKKSTLEKEVMMIKDPDQDQDQEQEQEQGEEQ